MTRSRPFYIGMLLSMLLLGACTSPEATNPANKNPRFDWFEYVGNDAVYNQQARTDSQYYNPILTGFYPDPSIARAGDDYYLVTSSFSYFPGVPIFHSKDLVNWTQIGHVLDRPSQLNIVDQRMSRGVFAPTIRYHDGTFYMINTLVDAGGNFIVTATDPAGPWSDPILLGFDGIDPSMFFDDDGKVYVTNNGPPDYEPLYNGHRAIWIQEFDPEAQEMVGPRTVIVDGGVDLSQEPIWIEAPHIFKVDGTYYLICAEGGTGYNHSEVVFKSDNATGPYVPYENNPILTQRHLDPSRPHPITTTGHADFVQLPNGDWWAVFLGTRPYEGDFYNTGRETFLLPVRWENGWPHMLEGEATVPYVLDKPALPPQPAASIPHSGNFTIRDDFDGPELPIYWDFIRTPREVWYDFTTSPGSVTLRARPAAIDGFSQPSYIGRRQQHLTATASTAMTYRPEQPGDKAGMAAFQNDNYFYLLAVTLVDGRPVVQLEKKAGEAPAEVIASAPVDSETVFLKIDAEGDTYHFSYGTTPDDWTLLHGDADGKILSTQTAGGFIGAYFGLYAYTPAL